MKTMTRAFSFLSGLLGACTAWAHDGHGMPTEIHWHATDVLGLTIAIGFMALAYWLSRGGK